MAPFPHQVVVAAVVDHPALFHHRGAFPLGVFDRLNDSHQRDVAAGGRAKHTHTHITDHCTNVRNVLVVVVTGLNCRSTKQ